MNISLPVKPLQIISKLHALLLPHATKMDVAPKKRLSWQHRDEPQFYLLISGELSVLREQDKLVLGTVYDEHVFGIAEARLPSQYHLLRVEAPSVIYRIDARQAFALIHSAGLWEEVTELLSYHMNYLLYRDALILQQKNYNVIRNHLLDLIQLPEEYRMRTSILNYVQERTHISRSSVLSTLAALKKGKYIRVQRGGYLLAVEKLPDNY